MKFAVPWKLWCHRLTNVQGSQNGRFVNLHNSLKLQNSQKKHKKIENYIKKFFLNQTKLLQVWQVSHDCRSSVVLFYALCGPLRYCRSSVVLFYAPLRSFVGPLRYLVISSIRVVQNDLPSYQSPRCCPLNSR